MKIIREPEAQTLYKDPDETRRKKDRPEKKIPKNLRSDSAEDTSSGLAGKAKKTKAIRTTEDDWDEDDMLTILEYRRKGQLKPLPSDLRDTDLDSE